MDQTINVNQIVKKLKAVSYALNQLEVKGRQNLDILLGSIQEIDRSAVMLEKSLMEMVPSVVPDSTETGEKENDSK